MVDRFKRSDKKSQLLRFLDEVGGQESKDRMNTHCMSSFSRERTQGSKSFGSSMLWICFPHFSLESCKAIKHVTNDLDHIDKTLMQSSAATPDKKRELRQAVSKHTKSEKCLFVSQLWCLVIDKGQNNTP